MFESLFNQLATLQISNFVNKRFQRRCFSGNIGKFLKSLILKNICERLLLNNLKWNYSIFMILKKVLNVSQHSQENTSTGVSFLTKIVVACNLSLSLFKKRFQHWCFPDSYLKFLTPFLKREKRHCYKKRSIVIRNVNQISIANLITPFFVWLCQDFCISARS